jgi:hypothetical protein
MSRAIAERRATMPDASLAADHAEVDDASPARPLNEYLTIELKRELVRRGLTDFSRWEWLVKLAPFALLFIAATLWKLGQDNPGSILACLTGW